MNKKSVYTCETCSALYVCLKYFQEHRKKHAIQEGRTIFPCTYCQTVHTSEHESHLHSISHKNEAPHSCEVCQEMLGISGEEVSGTRRSIGTATDFHGINLSLDCKPTTNDSYNTTNAVNNHNATKNSNNSNMISSNNDHDDGDDNDNDEDDDDEDDDEDDDDDDDEDDDDDVDEDEEEEDGDNQVVDSKQQKDLGPICKSNVTNIIYVTNQTINHTTTSQNQRIHLRPSRPSRSMGKGKGNRKARLTSDGDIKRKFSCCHCGKSFKTKSHLQRHILTHTGEKPYHCNRCDGRFNQSSSLRNHVIAIHTKEFPHICNNCSKGFLMPAVLQKHLQTSECGKISNQVVEGL